MFPETMRSLETLNSRPARSSAAFIAENADVGTREHLLRVFRKHKSARVIWNKYTFDGLSKVHDTENFLVRDLLRSSALFSYYVTKIVEQAVR